MPTSPPQRPLLRQDTVALEVPGGVFVRGAGDSFIVRGKGVYRYLSTLLPHLDGGTTFEEMTSGLPTAHVDAVGSLLSQLASRGVLIDAPTPGDHVEDTLRESFPAQVSLMEQHGDDGRGFLRVAEARVAVIADTRAGATLAESLKVNGVGAKGTVTVHGADEEVDLTGVDLVCAVSLEGTYPRLVESSRAARAVGTAFLPLVRVGDRLVIGPWQASDGGVDVCSLLLRMSDNGVPGMLGVWQAIGSGAAAPRLPALSETAVTMAVEMMGFEAFKALGEVLSPDVEAHAVIVDPGFLTVRTEPVTAHPAGDTHPIPHHQERESKSLSGIEAAYVRFEPLMAETAGIVGRFDDDALPQIPVKTSLLRAPAVRSEPMVAFSSDTVMRARLTVLERAVAEYAVGVCRRLDSTPEPAPNARTVEAARLESWTGSRSSSDMWAAATDMADGSALAVPRDAVLAGPWDRDVACFEPALIGLAAGTTAEEAADRAMRDAIAARVLATAWRGDAEMRPVGAELIDKALTGEERTRLAMLSEELRRSERETELLLVPGAVPVAVVRVTDQIVARTGITWAEAAEAALCEIVGRLHIGEVEDSAPLLGAVDDLAIAPAGTPLDDADTLTLSSTRDQALSRLGAEGRAVALTELTPTDVVGVAHVARALVYQG